MSLGSNATRTLLGSHGNASASEDFSPIIEKEPAMLDAANARSTRSAEVWDVITEYFRSRKSFIPEGMKVYGAQMAFKSRLSREDWVELMDCEPRDTVTLVEKLFKAWYQHQELEERFRELLFVRSPSRTSPSIISDHDRQLESEVVHIDEAHAEPGPVVQTYDVLAGSAHAACKLHMLGACQKGDSCEFSHDLGDSYENVCKYFRKGTCMHGSECANKHIFADGRRVDHRRSDPWEEIEPDHEKHVAQDEDAHHFHTRRDHERIEQELGHAALPGFRKSNQFSESYRSPSSFASYYSAQSSLRANSPQTSFTVGSYHSAVPKHMSQSFRQSPAYYSAKSSLTMMSRKSRDSPTVHSSNYLKAVHEKGLILPVDQELNWSGKANGGQHVEYSRGEELPFDVLGPIGASLTAQVDKVRCRRILLARKSMVCGRRLSVDEALVEVEHLQFSRHPHIVQLVGSYLQGKKFSVLLYPVADCDLSVFLDEIQETMQEARDNGNLCNNGKTGVVVYPTSILSMWSFFGCLVDAVGYIHSAARKHLDIKPANILVKKHAEARYGYRVYLADFGISRSFKTLDHSQTDAPIRKTPKYCAPEVWEQGVHGRAADIFSLGCVFMEMLTVLAGYELDEFADFRDMDGNGAYHATIDRVITWAEGLRPQIARIHGEMVLKDFTTGYWFTTPGLIIASTLEMICRSPESRKLPMFSALELPSGIHSEMGSEDCFTCRQKREKYVYDEAN